MDWKTSENEAVEHLRKLVRFETVNPPGNEGPAASYVIEQLGEAGLDPTRVDSEGRPNVVVRLNGDGSLDGGPLLLAGHLDVVGVEPEHWSHPPFGAEIDGDYLFGRGTLDMKNMVAMCLTIVRQLARAGVKLGRDVIFAAVSDEEAGCQHGSRFLVENHPELVQAECMLGELGAFSLDIKKTRYYPIQVAEKGTCRIELTARGDPGHGSMPHQNNAVVKLAQAVAALGHHPLPQHRVTSVVRFVRELARSQGFPANLVLPRLLNPVWSRLLLRRVLDEDSAKSFAANLSNTVTPTILTAGEKINVIPGQATAQLDGRILPGQTADDLVAEVRTIIGDDIEISVLSTHPGRENSTSHPLFETLVSTLRQHDPQGVPIPMMLPGFTDAAYFGRLVPNCFGFSPIRFPREDEIAISKLPHGHDERIHIPGFKWGLRVLYDAIVRHCAKAGDKASASD